MTNHSRTILVALVTMTVALAGCTSDDGDGSMSEGEQSTDGDPIELGDQGAITGLVVDDNFRPLQLKEDWGSNTPGEFQDQGFVLVLETAQRFETNENGEFKVLPLDPGTYTVRVAADNHEAIDQKVEVVAGEFAEITLEARRQFSSGGTTLSQEYVVFIQCSANAGSIGATNVLCGDLSGDGQRAAFYPDYSGSKELIRGMVTEMRATHQGYYSVDLRIHDLSCSDYNSINGCLFTRNDVENGDYIRNVLYPHKQWQPDGEYLEEGQEGYCTITDYDEGAEGCGPYFAMTFDLPFQTILFPDHPNRQYLDPIYEQYRPVAYPIRDQVCDAVNPPLCLGGIGYGIGPVLGVKAQFLQTVFLYELPEEGIDGFCALCEDADIPE